MRQVIDVPQRDTATDPILQAQLEAVLHEVEIHNLRVVRDAESDGKSYTYSMVALIAALIAASLAMHLRVYVLMLLVPFPLYVLSWRWAGRAVTSANHIQYITNTLIPNVDRAIREIKLERRALGASQAKCALSIDEKPVYLTPKPVAQIAGAALQLVVVALILAAYLVGRPASPSHFICQLSGVLLWLNGIAGFLSVAGLLAAIASWAASTSNEVLRFKS